MNLRWDHLLIRRGLEALDRALEVGAGALGSYGLQAAIAACHARAPAADATDWHEIARLYGLLVTTVPSPVVELNRAVAVSMADGPAAGLAIAQEQRDGGLERGGRCDQGVGELCHVASGRAESPGRDQRRQVPWLDRSVLVAMRDGFTGANGKARRGHFERLEDALLDQLRIGFATRPAKCVAEQAGPEIAIFEHRAGHAVGLPALQECEQRCRQSAGVGMP